MRNKHRAERIERGLCRDCGKGPPRLNKVICEACHISRKLRQENRKHSLLSNDKCLQCSKSKEGKGTHCKNCMDLRVERSRHTRKRNKLFIIEAFGGKCCECSEKDIRCLSLDHINNDGAKDCAGPTKRIISPQWYARLVVKIKAGNKPSDLQLLCFNCHAKKDLKPWWFDET